MIMKYLSKIITLYESAEKNGRINSLRPSDAYMRQ